MSKKRAPGRSLEEWMELVTRSFASKIACKCRIFNIFLFLISPKIYLGEIFSEVHKLHWLLLSK